MTEFGRTVVQRNCHLPASLPSSTTPPSIATNPRVLSNPLRYFNRDEPFQVFSAWVNKFSVLQFPRDRLLDCCRNFVCSTLPSWTIAHSPDTTAFPSAASAPSRLPVLPALRVKFSSSCVPCNVACSAVVLPYQHSCAFEWRDDTGVLFQCGAIPFAPGEQDASWMMMCCSDIGVDSFVITGRVSLGSLSCYRSQSLNSHAPSSRDQCSFARYQLIAVPHCSSGGGIDGISESSRRWLSDLNCISQLECLRSGYPTHDLSVPFSSPFVFQQQRRVTLGHRTFSSAFGQTMNKRANFGHS